MGGGSGSLTNSGTIASTGSAGVDAEGAGNVVTNGAGGDHLWWLGRRL